MALDDGFDPPPSPLTARRLRQDEVARVLARAVQLAALDGDGPEGVPVWVVEAAAADVGVEPAAVRRAVAELRAGLLPGGVEVAVPASAVVVQRVLVLPGAAVAEEVAGFLDRQLFAPVRHRGLEQRWRRRSDLVAGVRRSADVRGHLCLGGVEEVQVRMAELDGGTVVHLGARLAAGWRHAGAWGATPGAVAGAATAVVAVTTGVPDVVALVAAPAGAALAGSGWAVGRHVRRERTARVTDQLEGWLDELEREGGSRRPGPGLARLQVLVQERWSVLRVGAGKLRPPTPPPPAPPDPHAPPR